MLTLYIFALLAPPLLLAWSVSRDWRRTRALAALAVAGVDRMSSDAFEGLVASLLARDGHRVRRTGGTGDMGADLVTGSAVIQCKRYSSPAGVEAVQQAFTAAAFYRRRSAVVVATHGFTRAAKKLACGVGVQLVNRASLADWLQGRSVV